MFVFKQCDAAVQTTHTVQFAHATHIHHADQSALTGRVIHGAAVQAVQAAQTDVALTQFHPAHPTQPLLAIVQLLVIDVFAYTL